MYIVHWKEYHKNIKTLKTLKTIIDLLDPLNKTWRTGGSSSR